MAANLAEPVYRYQRSGFMFEVWPGRVDVAERRILGTKRHTIPLRSITQVEAAGITGTLQITTRQGRYEFAIGPHRGPAREAILAQMWGGAGGRGDETEVRA